MDSNGKIIIGVSVGSLLVVGGLAVFIFLDKRRKQPAITSSAPSSHQAKGKPSVDASPVVYLANPYATSAAITKIKNGSYEPYVDDTTTSTKIYNDYKEWQKLVKAQFGESIRDGVNAREDYPRAWFKGMNLALNPKYYNEFKGDITNYSTGVFKMPFWDIQIGEYINF
jgi:hypothetical protein